MASENKFDQWNERKKKIDKIKKTSYIFLKKMPLCKAKGGPNQAQNVLGEQNYSNHDVFCVKSQDISINISLPFRESSGKAKKLSDYLENFYQRDQGFYLLPYERDVLVDIKKFVEKFPQNFENIVILGIGGSGLGPRTILEAFGQNYPTKNSRKFFVLDSVDPEKIAEVESQIILEKTFFITITKSGGTAETMSQYFYFAEKICGKNLAIKDHFAFISDEGSSLHARAMDLGVVYFPIPQNVGGRFSVLTSVGLLIVELMGLDTGKLLDGAKGIADKFKSKNPQENICYQAAEFLYQEHSRQSPLTNGDLGEFSRQALEGKKTWVFFPYSEKLKSFGEWFVQLVGESTGKINNHGDKVGITPLMAVGARDQHSVLQLFAEGPEDKVFTFLKVKNFGKDLKIPQISEEKFGYLSGKSFGDLLNAELEGTKKSLEERGLPVFSLEIEKLDEVSLGALFFFFEGVTAFLGEFLEVNAFDQPGVERSKELTRASMRVL